MIKVNGNIDALLEIKTVEVNEIGEGVETWQSLKSLRGWLDLSNGIANKHYEILLIDNPMELNYHIEFYLKYTGV